MMLQPSVLLLSLEAPSIRIDTMARGHPSCGMTSIQVQAGKSRSRRRSEVRVLGVGVLVPILLRGRSFWGLFPRPLWLGWSGWAGLGWAGGASFLLR